MSAASPDRPSWPALARDTIAHAVLGTAAPELPAPDGAARPHSGAFVTLRQGARLRGCMGTLDPQLTRVAAVQQAARTAALHDPRFPPLTAAELALVTIEVSILSAPTPLHTLDDLVLGRHGIIVQRGPARGLFLPQVATEHRLDKETFLRRCCQEKAGLAGDAWRDPGTTVLLFEAEVYREE